MRLVVLRLFVCVLALLAYQAVMADSEGADCKVAEATVGWVLACETEPAFEAAQEKMDISYAAFLSAMTHASDYDSSMKQRLGEAVRNTQRAWLVFVKADCERSGLLAGSGLWRAIAELECETAAYNDRARYYTDEKRALVL